MDDFRRYARNRFLDTQIWGNGELIRGSCKFLTDLEVVKQFRGDRFGTFRMAIHCALISCWNFQTDSKCLKMVFHCAFTSCVDCENSGQIRRNRNGCGLVDYTGCVWGHHIMGAGEEDATLSRGPYLFPVILLCCYKLEFVCLLAFGGWSYCATPREPRWPMAGAAEEVPARQLHSPAFDSVWSEAVEDCIDFFQRSATAVTGGSISVVSMEDDRIFLDTTRAELPVWLLKCPPALSRAFQSVASNSSATTSPVVAKITHTVDLLHLDDPSSEQNDHGMFMRPMPGIVVGQLPSSSKEKRKLTQSKRPDVKRVRKDKREMLNILFKLFERQPNWGLKQLVLETDQPRLDTLNFAVLSDMFFSGSPEFGRCAAISPVITDTECSWYTVFALEDQQDHRTKVEL
ncbi:hypothetical protein ZIOFF_035375 [Zingiber officinale]|uniref:Uncharacterized protein n=1 Tax=Zingiber officinale TaxID=94328 RepID=A0A8J5GBY2_ZINOF|nr:hypothetical protein ZIOFF_035375 [Zingiber officinale]